MKKIIHNIFLIGLFFYVPLLMSKPVAHWSFDDKTKSEVKEKITGHSDKIIGWHKYVPGVLGNAIQFNGVNTIIEHPADKSPSLKDEFTVEAWIALQAYPWTWCGIIDQEQEEKKGYFFAVSPEGYFGLHIAVNGKWQICSSKTNLPLYKWHHISATYHEDEGIKIYLNGKQMGSLKINGTPDYTEKTDLYIGRNHTARIITYPIRHPMPAHFSFDGLIDEIKIYNTRLSAKELMASYTKNKPKNPTPLSVPKLPSGPEGTGKFGAAYTRLKYTESWESAWRVGSHPDIVVRFDQAPFRMVFWRGTSFIPCWVTENGKWYTEEFYETKSFGMPTSAEPMADKQTRNSHVRVIESAGRWAIAPDRVSHSSLTHVFWAPYEETENTLTKIMMIGMTDKKAEDLVPLAHSWLHPPELKLESKGYKNSGYDQTQRAYVLECTSPNQPQELKFKLIPPKGSSIVNPAIVIKNWGEKDVSLTMNNKKVAQGKDFRSGKNLAVDGIDLVVWIKLQSTKPHMIILKSK